jgi:choline-sulfatase
MRHRHSAVTSTSTAALRHRSVVVIVLALASLTVPHDFSLRASASGVRLAALGAAPDLHHGLQAQGAAERPDVVILLTDQQRADAFGAAGAVDVRTPVMDRIARQGVHFAKAFTPTPQCSAARAALLTGRHPHRTGVMGNVGEAAGRRGRSGEGRPPAGMSAPLDRSLFTIGRVFAASGYETAYFGKWHLGGTPGEYGFATHSTIGDAGLAREVVRFLQGRTAKRARAPLLLIVSWLNPHDIYGVLSAPPPAQSALAAAALPANLADDLTGKPHPQRHYLEEDQGKPFVGAGRDVWRRYRAFYNGLVETVDREIGTVLDAVERRDVPPIAVFSTDHGDLGGAHGLPYKGPVMYEELVRIPLVISWPGKVRAGRSDALVSLVDLLPTLCDLTGVAAPAGVDGVSLRPVLERPTSQVREVVFSEYYGKQNWRVPIRMARDSRWKYVRYLGYGEELYDLAEDPGELRDLAREPGAASARARLARELDEWIRRTGDPFPGLATTDRSGHVVIAEQRR